MAAASSPQRGSLLQQVPAICLLVAALAIPYPSLQAATSEPMGYSAVVTDTGATFVFPLNRETMRQGFCHGWKPDASWILVDYEWRVVVRSKKEIQTLSASPQYVWVDEPLCKQGNVEPALRKIYCSTSNGTDFGHVKCRVSEDRTKLTMTLDWAGRQHYKGPIAGLLLKHPESVTFEMGPSPPTGVYRAHLNGLSPFPTTSFDVPVGYPPSTSASASGVCGSGRSTALVPDYVCFNRLGIRAPYEQCGVNPINHRVDFTAACSRHDVCYGKKGEAKSKCDAAFYADLKQACYSKLSGLKSPNSEKMLRSCIETALQYNDVVRGQETRRLEIWFTNGTAVPLPWYTQQIPFTGKLGCKAYLDGQRAAGAENPSCND